MTQKIVKVAFDINIDNVTTEVKPAEGGKPAQVHSNLVHTGDYRFHQVYGTQTYLVFKSTKNSNEPTHCIGMFNLNIHNTVTVNGKAYIPVKVLEGNFGIGKYAYMENDVPIFVDTIPSDSSKPEELKIIYYPAFSPETHQIDYLTSSDGLIERFSSQFAIFGFQISDLRDGLIREDVSSLEGEIGFKNDPHEKFQSHWMYTVSTGEWWFSNPIYRGDSNSIVYMDETVYPNLNVKDIPALQNGEGLTVTFSFIRKGGSSESYNFTGYDGNTKYQLLDGNAIEIVNAVRMLEVPTVDPGDPEPPKEITVILHQEDGVLKLGIVDSYVTDNMTVRDEMGDILTVGSRTTTPANIDSVVSNNYSIGMSSALEWFLVNGTFDDLYPNANFYVGHHSLTTINEYSPNKFISAAV
ncbi:hypothetical protein A1D22_05820 [Pasteurellaceae bacterium LFhippo2]|nr:hypothetical protein [Pasteurellaceae bacterium LFhippo2]